MQRRITQALTVALTSLMIAALFSNAPARTANNSLFAAAPVTDTVREAWYREALRAAKRAFVPMGDCPGRAKHVNLPPPAFAVPKVSQPPTLDGNLNDVCWQEAAVVTSPFEGLRPWNAVSAVPTLLLCHDSKSLYVATRGASSASVTFDGKNFPLQQVEASIPLAPSALNQPHSFALACANSDFAPTYSLRQWENTQPFTSGPLVVPSKSLTLTDFALRLRSEGNGTEGNGTASVPYVHVGRNVLELVPTGELDGGEIDVSLTLHSQIPNPKSQIPNQVVAKSLGVQKISADKSASAKFEVMIENDVPASLEVVATLNGRKVVSVYPICPAPVGDVLGKTEKLLADFGQMQGYKSAGMQETLAALKSERERLLRDGTATTDEWGKLYEKALTFRRAACFRNPLLNFDKLLFVKRHTFQSSHIYTDHFDGSSLMGGNVCVLSSDGKVTELAPSLNGGLFGRCDVSFDAKRVVFAYRKPTATPQTIAADAAGAVDGVKDGSFGFHTQNEPNPWWQVDLQKVHALNRVVVYNRTDVVPERAYSLMILLSDDEKNWRTVYRNEGKPFGGVGDNKPLVVQLNDAQARFVRLQLSEQQYFHLDEVEVYDERGQNVALRKPAKQSSAGQWSRQARTPTEGFLLYEVNEDGTNLRQLTYQPADVEEARQRYRHAYDDMDPCYLPDGRIMFVSTRTKNLVLCHNAFTVTTLHTMDANGKNVQQASDNPSNEFTPTVMEDGRVLYTRWEYVDKGSANVQSLWAMRPDGAHSTHVFKNNTDPPVALVDGRQISGSHKIVTVAAPHMPLTVGPVIIVDDHITRLTDAALTNVTPEIGYPPCVGYAELEEGYYKDPYPLSEKYFLVSYNFDANPAAPNGYAIYLLDVFGNKELIYRDPTISCFQPVPLVARRKPHTLPTYDSPLTTHHSPPEATILLLDVYRGLTGVKRGAVKYVRVMEDVPKPWGCQNAPNYGDSLGLQNPVVSLGGHFAVKKIHGTVPVAADGSAYFSVPAGKNLYFQALDENFMELQRMRTFVNLMPGETRTCIGCHEPRSESPPNHRAIALRQTEPKQITPPLWADAPTTVHFPRDVQPILDRHCVRCHNAKEAQGNLDLSSEATTLFNRAYENLVRKGLVNMIDVDPRGNFVSAMPPLTFGSHRSKVVEVIRKGHYGVKLEREEFVRLVSWIDANAPYYGTYAGRRNVKWKGTAEYRPEP